MDTYVTRFAGRNLVEPRFVSLDFFRTNGFQFQELLEYEGLKHFVSIECPYLIELMKVFYYNLTISHGDLCSEVKGVKIRVRPSDWLSLAGLEFEGLQQPNKVNAGSLNVEDRLLHYTLARILIPRGSNYAQLTEEDIFVLWAIEERILINWPQYICQHMQKMKARKMTDLPYAMLITKMFSHYGVDTGKEEDANEAPIAGTDNVTDVHCFDNNMQHIMTAIQGLHLSMTDHHNKVEKMMEELVNRVHGIEDRLPPPTSG
ncbi:hypothetical protein SESBI_49198 [Sesbania bispinosa]|nr:hypothetical protein SESBI_49198 [Sesbania bispinosa]